MTRPAVRRQLILWTLALGLWVLLVLAFAGQLVFARSVGWTQAVKISLRDWLSWLLLAPAVAWLALRFPLERRKLYFTFPVHVVGCAATLFITEGINRFLEPVLRPSAATGSEFRPPPFREPPDGGPPDLGPPPGRPERPGPRRFAPDEFPPERPFAPPPEARRPNFINNVVMRGRFNGPVYWIIVSMVHALTYYRRSQERERKAAELEGRLAQARLQALRMQLHPHFLFNTLHAISTLVYKDPKGADEMIANLSELLRATLDTSDQQEIRLRKELDLLERYLEIQQVRFGDRLRIEKQVDPQTLDASVPTLILQPLVENAIKHGIEPRPGPGEIVIGAHRSGTALQLSVRDNGNGVEGHPARDGSGIGLSNTRARLEQLYGKEAKLTLSRPSNGGCSVELELPFRNADSIIPENA